MRTLAGRYRLVEPIGQGGMGIVWRAVDTLLDREAAVKEVRVPSVLPAAEREEMYQRTLREARTAARLRHPNVVTLFDVVEEDERPWIVMDLVHARSLDQIVGSDGPLPPERAARIGRQILAALTAAHTAGVLHRDVKPANVLVGADDRVTLTDFGIATIEGDTSITTSGQLIGSPAYLGPERAAGDPATSASDLWALGATLFMAVEGRGPYDRDGAMATLGAVLTQEPPPAPHAGPLTPVIDGLLVRDPAHRMAAPTAAAMLDDISAGRPAVQAPSGADAQSTAIAAMPPMDPGATMSNALVPSTGPYDQAQQQPAGYAQAPPPGPYGGPPGPYTAPPPARRRRSATPFVLGGVGVLVFAALVVGGLWLLHIRSSGDPTPQADPEPKHSATGLSTPAAQQPTHTHHPKPKGTLPQAATPVGFWSAKDPRGFRVALPNSWDTEDRRALNDGVTYFSPSHHAYLLIDQTQQPTDNPMVNMRRFRADAMKDGKYPNISTVRLARTTFLGRPAAVWEFTWHEANGVLYHAEDRQVVLPGGRPVAVYWQSYANQWAATSRARMTAFTTFRMT
jgi:tRNA A-37 threonylcarbamoyl transferase component Bud32